MSCRLQTPLFLIVILLLPLTSVHAQGPVQVGAANQPLIQFSTQSDEPVIEYRLVHQMLADQDPVPLLRVYGDGHVHAHFPVYMKKAGDYEYQLSPLELRALLRSLSQDGIIDFDHATVKAERKRMKDQERAAGVLHYISDTTEIIIDIRLDEYRRNPAANRVMGLNKRFIWKNLEHDARRFPQSSTIGGAAIGAQRLHNLLNHSGMQAIR